MPNILSIFKKFGSLLKGVFKVIHKIIPDEQIAHAIDLAVEASTKFLTSAEKRDWVISQLMGRFPISESVARLLVELAVVHVKNGVAKAGEAAKAL